RRISGDENRPLLNDVDPLFKMISLAAQRNALYAEVADLRVDTEKLSDKEAVAKIINFLSD
ncbi:MAG: shikimate kinase, partial [Ghiorsea sp.]|nr:shikimate kinase [Ghiorsea sp.]